MPDTLRERLERNYTALDTERSSWRSHWQELAQYILPRRGRFLETDHNKGNKRNASIIDSTGTLAARTLASGMMAGITSPARPWFRLVPPDPEMREFHPVRSWLDTVETILREVFARSNIYNALHSAYRELGTFGTSPIFLQEDFEDVLRGYQLTVGSYMLGVNNRFVVNTIHRDIPMTVLQVAAQFGLENLSTGTRQLYDKGDYHQWVYVRHAIEPNNDRDVTLIDNTNMPFVSVYWEKGSQDDKVLRKSGYKQFPVLAPRWDVVGNDVYGSSPGMDALGDCKQLQVQQKEKGKGIAKQVNPPMVATPFLKDKVTNTLPGGVTYVEAQAGGQGFAPAYNVNFNLNDLKEDIFETQQRVKRAYYEDLFLMLASTDRREITAREVEERHEEKLLMLGPVMERLNDELLGPLIDRAFSVALDAGILPEAPRELEGVELGVEYISIMAQAQKLVGTAGIERLAGFAGQLAAGKPEVLDKIDADQMVDEYADMLGTPASLVLADEDVEAIRRERQQKQQQAENMAIAQQAAEAGKTASEIDTGGGENLVSQILGGGVPGV